MALPDRCPLCSAGSELQNVVTAHVYGAKAMGHAFFHCCGCDVRYQYPRLDPDDEAHFYAAEFEGFMEGRAGRQGGWRGAEEHIHANEQTRVRRLRYLAPMLTPASQLLEVGCSSGFMLLPLVEAGHVCVGIEPSGVFRDFLKAKGLRIFGSLDEMTDSIPSLRFDTILHFFVMEHIADPRSFLLSQLELLKPGGKIIFEIPNVADALYSVMDIPAFERFYWSIAHAWYFSEDALHYLLKQIGRPYQVLRDQRYDLSNHLVWARDGRPGGLGRFTDFLGRDLENEYRSTLIRIGKCDTLIGVISNE